ncbi:hypothetical protein AKO1_015855 [Acrasis kona]|uniref:JmjC domain-containing protein n=1 Tax=Acrasis kona TaxID=1008807 RepID=A0AAW2ZJB1_9EUKA
MSGLIQRTASHAGDIESPETPQDNFPISRHALHEPVGEYVDVVLNDPVKRSRVAKRFRRWLFIENKNVARGFIALAFLITITSLYFLLIKKKFSNVDTVFNADKKCYRGEGSMLTSTPGYTAVPIWDVDYNGELSTEYFYKNFMHLSKPLLIKNSINNWPAIKFWQNDDYLRENFGDQRVEFEQLRNEKSGKLKHKKITKRFSTFLKDYQASADHGFQYHLDSEVISSDPYSTDYKMPSFIPCAAQADKEDLYFTELRLEMGNGGQSTVLHNTDYDSAYAVIDGYKKVILFHPDQTKNLYEKLDYDNDDIRVSQVDPSKPDVKNYPLFQLIPAKEIYETLLAPGDILFIPALWFHQVESTCRHVSLDMRFDVRNAKDIHRDENDIDTLTMYEKVSNGESSCDQVKKWDFEMGVRRSRRNVGNNKNKKKAEKHSVPHDHISHVDHETINQPKKEYLNNLKKKKKEVVHKKPDTKIKRHTA